MHDYLLCVIYTHYTYIKIIFFQIFKDMRKYLNEKEFSMVQRKMRTRDLEIKKHKLRFHVIVPPYQFEESISLYYDLNC